MSAPPSPKNHGLEAELMDWVLKHGDVGAGPAKIDHDTNLLESAVLDSVAFIELLEFLEKKLGRQIDLANVDAGDFTSIRGLCRYVGRLEGRES